MASETTSEDDSETLTTYRAVGICQVEGDDGDELVKFELEESTSETAIENLVRKMDPLRYRIDEVQQGETQNRGLEEAYEGAFENDE